MQEHVGAGFEVFGLGVFGFVVTDSVFARYEDHPRRHLERQVAGVMPGTGMDIAVGEAKRRRGIPDGGDASFVKGDGVRLVLFLNT